jgi:hypothetical protein
MNEAAKSIPSVDCCNRRRPCRLGRGWQTSAERPARALAGEMLDKDRQDPVEVTRSEDQ